MLELWSLEQNSCLLYAHSIVHPYLISIKPDILIRLIYMHTVTCLYMQKLKIKFHILMSHLGRREKIQL
jgi:hypothetical protein